MPAPVSKKLPQKADEDLAELLPFACHGSAHLPMAEVDAYNVEIREQGRFVGDRANKRAFLALIEKWRKLAASRGEDPFAGLATEDLSRKKMVRALRTGETAAAGVLQSAIDEFAHGLVDVIERYLETSEWRRVELIVVGGGVRGWWLGELAIGRSQALLYERKLSIELRPTHADPDEGGLLGSAYLAPSWMFSGYDGILAVDIGGTNIRVGVVGMKIGKAGEVAKATVLRSAIWRHAEEEPTREQVTDKLCAMLHTLVRWGRKRKFRLAPFIGVGCPGRIRMDGAIDRGTQNLPGNWEVDKFNLPLLLRRNVEIAPAATTVALMHNDAVVQGLSELPWLGDVEHWAVLTIGTGLGNAKFTSPRPPPKRRRKF